MAAVMLSRKGAFDNTLFEEGVGGFVLYHNFFTGLFRFHFTHTMIMNSLLWMFAFFLGNLLYIYVVQSFGLLLPSVLVRPVIAITM